MSKTILITGASRGIGAATAILFAKQGYNVAVNYNKNAAAANEVLKQIESLGGSGACFKCDVANYEKTKQMVSDVTTTFGGIDVLVNNAGIAQQKLFTDITPQDWNNMISVNLSSVFNCCNTVLSQMIKNHQGRIINISSMWGETGGSCEVHYSAAKAGVIGLTKALAKEVAPSGITVNCISPGVIKTDMLKDFDTQTLKSLAYETPVGRLGTPKDVANAVYYLSLEESSFITGQVLGVNGGFV